MPTYQKLVRDYIPTIIEKSEKQYSTRILDENEYVEALKKKLYEEVNEVHEAQGQEDLLEELADVLEVIHALAKVNNSDMERVEQMRQTKAKERGGFDKRILLEEVKDN
ncbi:putative house-cleaning noncanonical NTP pyrophosphatase (MazG superfamily) [Alkalibacillus flavidus]|uniref:House-cleaning noncanonical NTP pyrophosphatase (MazG superfamily) n=1 Tax=Alkalibacillus flavidus TaxID=546021 RepID=A0ABV2KT70_9BACI